MCLSLLLMFVRRETCMVKAARLSRLRFLCEHDREKRESSAYLSVLGLGASAARGGAFLLELNGDAPGLIRSERLPFSSVHRRCSVHLTAPFILSRFRVRGY